MNAHFIPRLQAKGKAKAKAKAKEEEAHVGGSKAVDARVDFPWFARFKLVSLGFLWCSLVFIGFHWCLLVLIGFSLVFIVAVWVKANSAFN